MRVVVRLALLALCCCSSIISAAMPPAPPAPGGVLVAGLHTHPTVVDKITTEFSASPMLLHWAVQV